VNIRRTSDEHQTNINNKNNNDNNENKRIIKREFKHQTNFYILNHGKESINRIVY